jgi:hypothetical protein
VETRTISASRRSNRIGRSVATISASAPGPVAETSSRFAVLDLDLALARFARGERRHPRAHGSRRRASTVAARRRRGGVDGVRVGDDEVRALAARRVRDAEKHPGGPRVAAVCLDENHRARRRRRDGARRRDHPSLAGGRARTPIFTAREVSIREDIRAARVAEGVAEAPRREREGRDVGAVGVERRRFPAEGLRHREPRRERGREHPDQVPARVEHGAALHPGEHPRVEHEDRRGG